MTDRRRRTPEPVGGFLRNIEAKTRRFWLELDAGMKRFGGDERLKKARKIDKKPIEIVTRSRGRTGLAIFLSLISLISLISDWSVSLCFDF